MELSKIIEKYNEVILDLHADSLRDSLNAAQEKALREFLELFTAGRDALREQQERQWISVKDRMPEESHDEVLTYTEYGNFLCVPYSKRYNAFNVKDWFETDKTAIYTVTHWKLPEPPKEGK